MQNPYRPTPKETVSIEQYNKLRSEYNSVCGDLKIERLKYSRLSTKTNWISLVEFLIVVGLINLLMLSVVGWAILKPYVENC